MEINHKIIIPGIHLLSFDSQHDITSTFLRFQEYYESPYFKNKFFSLEEFKTWYVANSPNGIKTGKFTYYSDWNGFNIPSYVLTPFYDGKFNPLSNQEKQLLNIFKDETEIFYVIGVHGEYKNKNAVLRHEVAHALFYTDESYKKSVTKILSNYDIHDMKKEISALGYHDSVLDDEVHAFCIDTGGDLKTPMPEQLVIELGELFRKYYE